MTGKDIEQRHEDQLKGSSDGAGIKAYLMHRAKPHVPPWIGVGGVGAAGVLGHIVWAGDAGMGIGLTLGSVALSGATWWAGQETGPQRRVHATATVAAAGVWTTHAVAFGPSVVPFVVGGAVMALSWNMRQLMRRDPDGARTGNSDGGLLEKVGLARTKLKNIKVEANRVTVPYELPAGELTNDDVARTIPRIASALDVPTTAIRVQHDPDSARKGQIVIVPEDMLKTPTRWPGPYAAAQSVAVPLRIGVYDDGSALLLPLLDAIHILIMGMTGSGKTEGALDVMFELLTRKDVAVWLADAAKAGQDFLPLVPAMDWAALDTPSAGAMVAAVQAVIPVRTAWLRDHGYRAWEPAAAEPQTSTAHSCKKGRACGCPGIQYLVAWFEEAAKLLRELGDDTFTGIAQEARSAGMSLVVSMQRASGYQLSTDTRASLPAAACFGVRGDDASFALPEEVLDAGANPAAWGNKRKGYVYLVSAGIDEDMYANPARTFWTGPSGEYEKAAAWLVREFAGIRAAIDIVTSAAAEKVAGQLYATRKARALGVAETVVESEELMKEDDGQELADLQQELPPVEAVVDLPRDKPGPEAARELLDELIDVVASVGPGTVAVKDFAPYFEQLGRDRSWVSKELKKISEGGERLAVTGEAGVYRVLTILAGV